MQNNTSKITLENSVVLQLVTGKQLILHHVLLKA